MTQSALLLGSIGVLTETSELQRLAFNAAFAKHNLNWEWHCDDYKRMLKTSGGKQRIAKYAQARGEQVWVDAIYDSKREAFEALVEDCGLELRPGISDILADAYRRGIRIGFVTSTHRDQVEVILEGLSGALDARVFDYIGNAARVRQGKPAPDIYLDALEALGVAPEHALAIEDTPASAQAAVDAGIVTFAYPGDYAKGAEFPAQVRMVSEPSGALLTGLTVPDMPVAVAS